MWRLNFSSLEGYTGFSKNTFDIYVLITIVVVALIIVVVDDVDGVFVLLVDGAYAAMSIVVVGVAVDIVVAIFVVVVVVVVVVIKAGVIDLAVALVVDFIAIAGSAFAVIYASIIFVILVVVIVVVDVVDVVVTVVVIAAVDVVIADVVLVVVVVVAIVKATYYYCWFLILVPYNAIECSGLRCHLMLHMLHKVPLPISVIYVATNRKLFALYTNIVHGPLVCLVDFISCIPLNCECVPSCYDCMFIVPLIARDSMDLYLVHCTGYKLNCGIQATYASLSNDFPIFCIGFNILLLSNMYYVYKIDKLHSNCQVFELFTFSTNALPCYLFFISKFIEIGW